MLSGRGDDPFSLGEDLRVKREKDIEAAKSAKNTRTHFVRKGKNLEPLSVPLAFLVAET